MKKYNLSNIMSNAWAIRRRLVVTMSVALKRAWEIAKETKKMVGTEKQVKWASEIRSNIIKTFQAVINDSAPMAATNAIIQENIAGLQARIDRLTVDNIYAGDIIDLFKDIRFSGDYKDDFSRVLSVYNVGSTNTNGQREILMR